jgi:hypothetical protein
VATAGGDVCLFLCLDDRDCSFLEDPGLAGDDWPCRELTAPSGDPVKACAPPGVM